MPDQIGYKNVTTFDVTPELVEGMIHTCSDMLGLATPNGSPRIVYLGPILKRIFRLSHGAEAGYKNRKLFTPKRQTDATIFHELVHYIADDNGMIFCRGKMLPARTFYPSLIDETIAETATAFNYGYSDEFIEAFGTPYTGPPPVVEYLRNNPDTRRKMEQDIGITLPELEKEVEEHESIAFQRLLEARFLKDQKVDPDLYQKLMQRLGDLSYREINRIVRPVAVGNSIRMLSNGTEPSRLVSEIAARKHLKHDEIYFYGIVPLLGQNL